MNSSGLITRSVVPSRHNVLSFNSTCPAEQYGVDYLGALPLDLSIREQADAGRPSEVSDPDGEIAAIYKTVARQVAVKIAAKAKDFSSKFPTISISKTT